jgi:signal transduction histidine kinase/DNA-binding response OmpR family regulator
VEFDGEVFMNINKNPVILTIDDEQAVRDTICAYLEDYNYTVFVAKDGQNGLDVLKTHQIDLVLVDLRMPELDGIGVLSHIQKEMADLPVIVISGTGEISDVVKALRLGAWDYILKPIADMTILLHAVEKSLERAHLLKINKQNQSDLEAQVSQKTRELSEINTRLKRVVESTKKLLGCGKLSESAELLLQEFASHMEATGGSIYAVSADGLERLAALDGEHASIVMPFPLEPGSVFHRVMESNAPLFLHDIEEDNSIVSSGWDKYKDNSLLVFPILGAKGEIIAIVSLHSKKQPPFDLQDHDIGNILATYAGEVLQVANVSSALQSSEDRLRQAHKMEAIGTLAGGIAHDFNNILAAIIGYTDLSLISESCDPTIRKNLEQVKKASDRAKDLVAQILAFSRTEEFKEEIIDIAPVLKEALKLLRATIPSSITIKSDIPSGLGKVATDPTKIYQVLMNLCTNAAHAMGNREGVLTISFERVGRMDLPKEAQENRSRDWVMLSVTDTGSGISRENRERIFDPYFTTKEKGEGTGLGLAMVHGIVRSSGGVIDVISQPGSGSTFRLFFPSFGNEKFISNEIPFTSMRGGNERIIFVDDELMLAEMAGEMLEKLGYEVEVLADSREALRIFKASPGNYDLLITDQTMPHLSGMELARDALSVKPGLPVILYSGYSAAINTKALEEIGIRAFLMKPLSMSGLAEAVRSALDD